LQDVAPLVDALLGAAERQQQQQQGGDPALAAALRAPRRALAPLLLAGGPGAGTAAAGAREAVLRLLADAGGALRAAEAAEWPTLELSSHFAQSGNEQLWQHQQQQQQQQQNLHLPQQQHWPQQQLWEQAVIQGINALPSAAPLAAAAATATTPVVAAAAAAIPGPELTADASGSGGDCAGSSEGAGVYSSANGSRGGAAILRVSGINGTRVIALGAEQGQATAGAL
jgi:hypothetical protein